MSVWREDNLLHLFIIGTRYSLSGYTNDSSPNTLDYAILNDESEEILKIINSEEEKSKILKIINNEKEKSDDYYEYDYDYLDNLLEICILKDNLLVLKWLYDLYPQLDLFKLNNKFFKIACMWGYLDIAEWLIEINPSLDISIDNDEAFKLACLEKSIEIVNWLIYLKPSLLNKYAKEAFLADIYDKYGDDNYPIAEMLCIKKPSIFSLKIINGKISYKITNFK